MALTPDNASSSMIESLWEIALRITKEHADMLKADHSLASRLDADHELQSVHADRLVEKAMTTKLRHNYAFERVPVGCDLGWSCYDANKFDGPGSVIGYGLTQDQAVADYLDQLEPKPKTSAPLLYSGPFEPNDYGKEVTQGSHEDWMEDDRE